MSQDILKKGVYIRGGMKGERILLALGGLLHDIGKLSQRGGEKLEESVDLFGYQHAAYSLQAIRVLEDRLEEQKFLRIAQACFHHKPDSEHELAPEDLKVFREIFRLADIYASKERSRRVDEIEEREKKRLRPVFQLIGSEEWSWFYPLKPLELSRDVLFPINQDREGWIDWSGEYREGYRRLWEGFRGSLERVSFSEEEELLIKIYHLLYRYTWCVPASTWDTENYSRHFPDISLFDHSRVVSAVASSLWTDHNLSNLKNPEEVRLVLLEGDISGIQSFLYSITNEEQVAKRLRGRSVFLSILPELIARRFLRELEYPITNLLYSGGGKFQILIGYEENVEERLEGIWKSIERVLLKEFGGKLGLVVYWEVFPLKDLQNYRAVMERLFKKAREEKNRKFRHFLEEYDRIVNAGYISERAYIICPSCRWEMVEEGEEFCNWCKIFAKVGGEIPKSRFILFSEQRKDLPGFFLEGVGGVYFLKDPEPGEVYRLNKVEVEGVSGFKFLALSVPRDEEGGVMTFEEIAKKAEGDQKLIFAKADVDSLGYILKNGLPEEEHTISRIATLSRSLDLFFSGYLNVLFEEDGGFIYTVYAGGDDMFIIGPWDRTIKVLERVCEEFGDYTCWKLTLSCGSFLSSPSYPVRLAAEKVNIEEGKAKREKDSVSVLGEVLKWEELDTEKLDRILQELSVGRTFLYRVYLLVRRFFDMKNEGREEMYMFYPLFYYQLVRNVQDEEERRRIENLVLDENKDVRKEALFSLKYMLMKTRESGWWR